MEEETRRKLAESLTAESTDLLPHLPYLLQDLWELGGDPAVTVDMLRKAGFGPGKTVLDLACGKGAVAVRLAKELGVTVKGIDLLDDFVAYAREKAAKHGVEALCTFEQGDANAAAKAERGYDCVVFSAAGHILGPTDELLRKLCGTIKPGGYVWLDETYLEEQETRLQYAACEYPTDAQWRAAFRAHGLAETDRRPTDDARLEERNRADLAAIERRVGELCEKFPAQKELFLGYLASQRGEVEDLEQSLGGADLLLQWQNGG